MSKRRYVLKPRQKKILEALRNLGGLATTRQIAKAVELHVNGVSQSLSTLRDRKYVKYKDGKAGDMSWSLEVCI